MDRGVDPETADEKIVPVSDPAPEARPAPEQVHRCPVALTDGGMPVREHGGGSDRPVVGLPPVLREGRGTQADRPRQRVASTGA